MLKEILKRWVKHTVAHVLPQSDPIVEPQVQPRTSSMSIGPLGSYTFGTRSRIRYFFSADLPDGQLSSIPVRILDRPSITVSYPPMRVAGEFTTIFTSNEPENGIGSDSDTLRLLYSYFQRVYDRTVTPNGYKINFTLSSLDGFGNPLERWEFQGAWPMSINFGELDYSSSGVVDMEIQWRYDNLVYENPLRDFQNNLRHH